MAGIDKDWVESGTRRTATYLHLPSGTYTFKVQGSNSQGIWSDKISQLQITVLPPWWRTWWAYGIYLFMIGLVIRAYFKFTINRANKAVFLSHSQLHRKLEALTGCSPNRFIRMVRLTKAKEMLLQADISIGTVAIECGYSDAGYFSRVFRQETGMTPNDWRAGNTLILSGPDAAGGRT